MMKGVDTTAEPTDIALLDDQVHPLYLETVMTARGHQRRARAQKPRPYQLGAGVAVEQYQ
jgi:hypothetical protein